MVSVSRSRRAQWAAAAAGVTGTVLAVAPNVATGGSLPGFLEPLRFLAWPVVLVAGLVVAALQVFQTPRAPTTGDALAPRQLPPDVPDFTGRAAEVRFLLRAHRRLPLRGGRRHGGSVSLVHGSPGVGKSTLVRHVGHLLRPAFRDGQLYVDLRGAARAPAPPEDVLAGFLRALAVPEGDIPETLVELTAQFRTVTSSLRVLVILDNAADAAQVRALLPAGAGCATLVTSRGYLAIDGALTLRLDVLPAAEAAVLFAHAAQQDATSGDDAAVDEILRYCGGLPLALRIAGSRLRMRQDWSADDLAARVRDQRRRLDELRVDDLEVRTSFNLTYQSLPDPLAQAFRALGVYGGTAMGADAGAVLLDVDEATARERLDRLVDAALVQPSADRRYAAHDLLRLFAREQAQRPEFRAEREAAAGRLADWYCERAEHWFAKRSGSENPHPDGLEWFDAEWIGIVDAVEQAFAQQRWPVVWRTVTALFDSFRYRRLSSPLRRLCELAAEAARVAGNLEAYGTSTRNLGQVLRHFGPAAATIEQLVTAAEAFEAAKNLREQAETLKNLGEMYRIAGRHQQAFAAYHRAVELSVEGGADAGTASIVVQLGAAHMETGDFDSALALYEVGETMFRELGEALGLTWVQYYFGGAYSLLGRYEEAEERLQRGLAAAVDRRDLNGQAWFLHAIGRVAARQQHWAAAEAAFRREVEVCRLMKVDVTAAQAELDAARRKRMVPASRQSSGWL